MKRNNFLVLGLSLVLLASCGMDSFGKAVDGAEDFLEVASTGTSGLIVARSYCSFKASDGALDLGENVPVHSAELYKDMDFTLNSTIGDTSVSVTGFTKGGTQFLLTGDKNGVSSSNPNYLDAYRNETTSLIVADYSKVAGVYANMKDFAGKTSGEVGGVSYSSIYIATSLAGTTAGYTLKTTRVDGDKTYKLSEYITMDKVGDNWTFSYYSRRMTVKIGNDEHMYVTEYSFTCLTSLDEKPLKKKDNLGDVIFTIEGLTGDDIDPADDSILTSK